MSTVTVGPVNVSILDTPEQRAAARMRLEFHKAVLEQNGIPTLSELGTLRLTGAVAARPGVVVPPRTLAEPFPRLPFQGFPLRTVPVGVFLPAGAGGGGAAGTTSLRPGFVEASVLPTVEDGGGALADPAAERGLTARVAMPPRAAAITIATAYFVAQTVELADDAVIVLQQPHQYLTFIAERISVGRNVTLTYERPTPGAAVTSWAPGDKPAKPRKAPTPNGLWGVTGEAGTPGVAGGAGWAGVNAPEVELWVLELNGSPLFDLRGQDGGPGGRGRDGGDGGDGSDGRAEQYDWLGFCKSGAGWGGDGGPGGNGGPGGAGGGGGHGGRLNLYAPAPVLQRYAAGGFSISTDGGSGGPGGGPGAPGAGGAGGRLGARPKNCAMSEERHDGAPGPQGQQGTIGTVGPRGGAHADAVRFVPVDEDDFQRMLTLPALVSATPPRGVAGTSVTLNALRLTRDDILLLDDVPVPMTVVADTLATFTVPAMRGGFRVLTVRRADGASSNRLSFYVLPQVTAVGDGSRIKPGATVTVTGSGFAEGARVRVNSEDMPDAQFINASTMAFTLQRPQTTVDNPDGETGELQVVLADGTPSNTHTFIIDTLRILVLGDSVAWGQGLQLHEKYATIVERALAAAGGGIKSYTTILAHSGATVGVGDATVLPALPGEVPTSYPTTLQQLDEYTGAADAVDLVLVTAGLNDVNIRTILNPLNRPRDFAAAIERHCHQDLRTLLAAITAKFPSATVVATGYYPILSDQSDTNLLSAFVVAAGLTVAGLPGGVLGGALIPAILTNCRAFHELSTLAIAAAVDDVNDTLPAPRVLFADPGFGPANAALAPSPWVYAINPDLTPQDSIVAGDRAPACEANSTRTDVFQCRRASVGHPNPEGARAYGDAIMRALTRGAVDEEAGLPPFPQGFLWGVATAAMQNEGGITNNDWAAFVDSPAIRRRVHRITELGGQPLDLTPPGDAIRHADVSVLEADLDRAAALGVNAYRFSVEWARIQPTRASHDNELGDGDLDMAAVAYYDRVLDALAARSMTPVVSLNHLSLPLWVLDPPREQTILSVVGIPSASGDDPDFQGSMRGWENQETVTAFVRFVRYIVGRWRDRVRWWLTLNEPVGSMIGVGYIAGIWPPGFTGDGARAKSAYFNLIRAHVRSYQAIKELDPTSMVGIAHAMLHAKVTTAASDHLLGDQEAARNQFDYFYNWHMLDAIIDGRVDTEIHRRSSERNYLDEQELATFLGIELGPERPWRSHCDFVGLNFYRSVYVFVDVLVSAAAGFTGGRFVNNLEGSDQTHQLLNDLGWEISPGGFGELLRELHNRYNLPVLITENGIPQAVDRNRAAFITAHLEQLLRAIRDGVDVRGYLYWTLADNWEWQEGYRPQAHFGLFTVDREDPAQPRHLTDGAHALAYAISRGDLRGARDRFGNITPGGDRVRPPRHSPVLLAGTLGDQPMAMWLRVDPEGWLRGLLHEVGDNRLLPLLGQLEPRLGAFTLAHPSRPGVPAGTITGQRVSLNGTVAFTGTLTRTGTGTPWTASKDGLYGDWLAAPPLQRLRITHPTGDLASWTGMWLPDALPRGWQPLAVTVDGTSIILEANNARFSGSLAGSTLTGQITVADTTSAWSARRLDDLFAL